MNGDPAPLLAARGICKEFPGVRALDDVDFDLLPGEVHVLFGENGAGKSTLISILSGAGRPSAGRIEMNGETAEFHSVHDARALGISAVFQEFSLVPQMSAQENLFLGEERRKGLFLGTAEMRREASRILAELGFQLDVNRPVHRLTRAEQQMVEIAKAFRSELSVLILDEPTASLTDHETEQLFSLIRKLTARGVGIVYITHRMAEIRRIGDRITVLRDGRYVATLPVKDADDSSLVKLMTGRDVGAIFPELALPEPGREILELDGVTTPTNSVVDVSLNVRAGEIVGLAGLVGSGKSEAMQAAFGAVPLAAGEIRYLGKPVRKPSPRKAIRAGFLYMPPDRKDEGLMMMRSARENMSLAAIDSAPFRRGMFLDLGGEKTRVGEIARQLNLTPCQPERVVNHFSGGNQQKTMLARSLTKKFELIVFDEPTVGVDVGTRAAIYRFIVEQAQAGSAVVVISSELSEILNLSTRAYVLYRGRIQAEIERSELSEETVLEHYFEKGSV